MNVSVGRFYGGVKLTHDSFCCGPGKRDRRGLTVVQEVSRRRATRPTRNIHGVRGVLRGRNMTIGGGHIEQLVHLVYVRAICSRGYLSGRDKGTYCGVPCLLHGLAVSRPGRM